MLATTDPTVDDDRGSGYSEGSQWVNTATDAAFVCVDPAVGAAVWRGPHALLDGAIHTDTIEASVARGSLVYGNPTPKWAALAISATVGQVLQTDGTDPAWRTQHAQYVDFQDVLPSGVETVEQILTDTIHAGVLDAIAISDEGGLGVAWSTGEAGTPAGAIVETESGSDTCTDDKINYLVWASGTGLVLRTTPADPATEVQIGHISAAGGDIYHVHEDDLISRTVPAIKDGLEYLLPIAVVSGCLCRSTNPGVDLEVSVSSGSYVHAAHVRHVVTGFDTGTASTLVRCHMDGAGPDFLGVG